MPLPAALRGFHSLPAAASAGQVVPKATILDDKPSWMTILHDLASETPVSTSEAPHISKTPIGSTLEEVPGNPAQTPCAQGVFPQWEVSPS